MATITESLDLLKELGMDKAAKKVETSQEMVRKTALAYEHFDYISQEEVDQYNADLRQKTIKDEKGAKHYMTLKFYDIKEYSEVPPVEVLQKLKDAIAFKCFDSFEIAKLESVVEVPDPILFGKIKDCGDLFFIAEWDNDITLEAIRAATSKK